jgi:hypothetical protein
MAKGTNSPKMELFDVVARLEPGLVDFGHTLDQRDSAINNFRISRGGVIISEQTSVRHNSKPTFTGHYKSTQRRDSIGV